MFFTSCGIYYYFIVIFQQYQRKKKKIKNQNQILPKNKKGRISEGLSGEDERERWLRDGLRGVGSISRERFGLIDKFFKKLEFKIYSTSIFFNF